MLRVITGRFHPQLESALVDQIRRVKAAEPLAPVAVLVPSKSLLNHVRRLLAVEQGLALLNVRFLTFHQLALSLADELRRQPPFRQPLRVVDELVFEQLVRHIVRTRLSSLVPLQQIGHTSGTWGALWSTLRDLKDAGVDPDVALRGLGEGYFDQDDTTWLQALFSLHAAVKEAGRTLEVGTPDDLAESLTPALATSPYLATLKHACYYGFYDLTQVQLSVFEAVSKTVPTTLFFPLDPDPSFRFAQRFFDRHIQPLVGQPEGIVRLSQAPSKGAHVYSHTLSCFVRSVVGIEEELSLVCRTILDLVETNEYQFEDIGIVARTLDPYKMQLESVFDRHRIPFTANSGCPLIHEPVCKVLLQLASLPLNDFYRTDVLDVLTSPLYKTPLCDGTSEQFRPDLWKLIVPALHITRGREEWKRVEQASRSALEIEEGAEHGATERMGIASEVIGLFWDVVSELLTHCAALPQLGTVAQLVETFQRLLSQHLIHPDETDQHDQGTHEARFVATWIAIDRVLTTLTELESLGEQMTWVEFVELLTHALERTMMQPDETPHRGVAVLDAMAARGVPFRALFVLGLNEKVFPRYIREDAFLRDRHRRVLDATLGFKIDEKLIGYEEESLLFTLLCQAASQRLYLSYQRADDQGRTLASSPYLAQANRCFAVDEMPVEAVPRRLTDRVSQRPTIRMFLPPIDLVLWATMSGQDPTAVLQATGGDGDSLRHSLEALEQMEDESVRLNEFDGLTGPLEAHWSRLLRRGMAPTPLERYARCPFQYFAADVLRLDPIRVPPVEGLDAAVLGTLCHAALRRCYEQLLPTGWPAEPVMQDTIDCYIRDAVEQAAGDCEARQRTGHYVLWELAKDMIVSLVAAAVEADQAIQAETPFTPVAFEVDAEGTIPGLVLAGDVPIKIHGRLDRIDHYRDSGELRIVDYKLKIGSHQAPEDRNLVQSAVRGARLQPPLYACLTIMDQQRPSHVEFFFLAPNWSRTIGRSVFETAVWASEVGTLLQRTVKTLMEGIQAGRYFILPNSYCDSCAFRVACRREHGPTWWRSYRGAESKTIKSLRAQRIKDE
jgi:ATP-dependent helicase/nuclease subunit B